MSERSGSLIGMEIAAEVRAPPMVGVVDDRGTHGRGEVREATGEALLEPE
jgi:hypothetical protein